MGENPSAIFIGDDPAGETIRAGRLAGAAGRLCARGSATCLIFDL